MVAHDIYFDFNAPVITNTTLNTIDRRWQYFSHDTSVCIGTNFHQFDFHRNGLGVGLYFMEIKTTDGRAVGMGKFLVED